MVIGSVAHRHTAIFKYVVFRVHPLRRSEFAKFKIGDRIAPPVDKC